MGSWEVDTSSGFLTNFRGTVKDSYAGTDPRYNEGKTTMAIFVVEVDEILQDWEGEDTEELNISFPLGSGWFTEDGQTVEHERKKEKFHASSIYGKIVAAITGATDGYGTNATRTDGEKLVVDLTPLADVLAERGDPQDMAIWKDIGFEFAEVHFDYGTDKDDKPISTNRTMPVAVSQVDGRATSTPKPAAAKRSTAKGKAAEKAAAAKAKAAAKKAEKSADDGSNPFAELTDDADLASKLFEILTTSEDYDSFIESVLEMDEVVSNDELLAKIVDDDNGPWALTHQS